MNSWIVIVDERRAGGMLHAARKLGGEVVAVVVGPRSLADAMAGKGFDRVLCFETAESVPPEAYAAQVAQTAADVSPTPAVIMASDSPIGRMILGAIAAKLNAALIGGVQSLDIADGSLIVSKAIAEGKVIEDVEVQGTAAVIYEGEDMNISSTDTVSVTFVNMEETKKTMKVIETIESNGDNGGLLYANRVIGVGMGLKSKDDLKLIEGLAKALHAEIGCTLPLCDDMRWFPPQKVIGSSHMQISPELYIGIGISGQPHHTSGIKDAKIVVAINNDPEARFFKNCDYGIVGDLYKIVSALTTAFQNIG